MKKDIGDEGLRDKKQKGTDKIEKNIILIHVDGGCRKNVAAYGYTVKKNGKTIREDYGILKRGKGATNNYAEYMAPIKALSWLKGSDEGIDKVLVRSDSQLMVKQINGEWKVKSDNIVDLYGELKKLKSYFEKHHDIEFEHVPREENERADELAEQALEDHFLARKIRGEDKKQCPECSSEMVIRKGKYGKFWGCKGYPECKHTENIDD